MDRSHCASPRHGPDRASVRRSGIRASMTDALHNVACSPSRCCYDLVTVFVFGVSPLSGGCYVHAMPEPSLHVLAVIGSLHRDSVTRVVVARVAQSLEEGGCGVDVLDLEKEPLALYNPDTSHDSPEYAALQKRVERADVIVLGTPDYHGSISSTLKNFLDHFWHEFAGKLFATIVASHEKGLTVTDQLRTVARQCYAWSLPYGVSFADQVDVQDSGLISDSLQKRLEMLARDLRIYGELLARQRSADLAGTDSGFMARLRGSEA